MKRWIIYLLVLVAIVWLNQRNPGGRDLVRMEPVEIIRIQSDGYHIRIEADTGRQGIGTDINEAVRDLKRTADKEIFLETAEFLLVHENAMVCMDDLMSMLRPSCKVCIENGQADLRKVAAFLRMQEPDVTLKQYRINPVRLPELIATEERMHLVQS